MPTYIPLTPAPFQFQASDSTNLSAGVLTFFASGTTTPINLYSNASGTSIGTSITLNSSGYPESGGNVITLFRDSTVAVKLVLKNSAGTTQWTADGLNSELTVLALTTTGNGAALVGIEDSAGNFTGTDVEAGLAETYADSMQNLVEDTTPQLGGELDCQDEVVSTAQIKDYGITHNTVTPTSGAITLDLSTGNSFFLSLTENITAITISNPPATGIRGDLTLVMTQDGTGSRTVAGWPASVQWPGGTAPTITTTATTGTDIVIMSTFDAGTTWRANFGQDYS